jgi:hypothetical protein
MQFLSVPRSYIRRAALEEKTMTEQQNSLGHQIIEKVVRTGIAIVGLLILRLILSALPVLNHAAPLYPDIWVDSWRVTEADVQGGDQGERSMAEKLQKTLGSSYEPIVRSFTDYLNAKGLRGNRVDHGAVLDAFQGWLSSTHMAIFPITIARAVIDTLILLLLIFFGLELKNLCRSGYARFPDLGQVLNLCILAIVAAIAYVSYQGLLYPLIGPDGQAVYDWVFLLIGLAPLIGIAIMASRNMDRLTALVMRSGSLVATAGVEVPVCAGGCGYAIPPGTRFCPNCGAPASVPATNQFVRHCSSCGANNSPTARFCKTCGRAA